MTTGESVFTGRPLTGWFAGDYKLTLWHGPIMVCANRVARNAHPHVGTALPPSEGERMRPCRLRSPLNERHAVCVRR